MTAFGLSETVLNKIRAVLENYPEAEKCIIYGSRALGTHRPNSDIDLTLTGENLNFSTLLKIENELDDLLLPYQIDLSIISQIDNNNLIDHIIRAGKVFYKKNQKTFESATKSKV